MGACRLAPAALGSSTMQVVCCVGNMTKDRAFVSRSMGCAREQWHGRARSPVNSGHPVASGHPVTICSLTMFQLLKQNLDMRSQPERLLFVQSRFLPGPLLALQSAG